MGHLDAWTLSFHPPRSSPLVTSDSPPVIRHTVEPLLGIGEVTAQRSHLVSARLLPTGVRVTDSWKRHDPGGVLRPRLPARPPAPLDLTDPEPRGSAAGASPHHAHL